MAMVVTNSPSKEHAMEESRRFLQYYPYRLAAVVRTKCGTWGWCSGKTMARMNRLAREGNEVYLIKRA